MLCRKFLSGSLLRISFCVSLVSYWSCTTSIVILQVLHPCWNALVPAQGCCCIICHTSHINVWRSRQWSLCSKNDPEVSCLGFGAVWTSWAEYGTYAVPLLLVCDWSLTLENPDFYCDNQLMLGKTYLKLGRREEARLWLRKTLEYKTYRPEDEQVCSVCIRTLWGSL